MIKISTDGIEAVIQRLTRNAAKDIRHKSARIFCWAKPPKCNYWREVLMLMACSRASDIIILLADGGSAMAILNVDDYHWNLQELPGPDTRISLDTQPLMW